LAITNQQIDDWLNETIVNYPDQVASYKTGKLQVAAFFVGRVMQRSLGQANPTYLQQRVTQRLNEV
jgi:aspartyl-tRNA(Asn)/glutamyl-tRNA(Gln) amidotransferase subunit B